MLPFRRSVGSSIKKVFIINSLCCLKAFPYLFSKQKLLKQKMPSQKRVKSFPLTDYISLPLEQKTRAKVNPLNLFYNNWKEASKMNKKYWSSIQCLKKFSEWFSIRTILTQADQVTHATRDSLSLLRFWGMGTFIVTSTRTKNQSVRVRNTINSTDTLEGNKLLFESLSCFRAKKRRNNCETNTFISHRKSINLLTI